MKKIAVIFSVFAVLLMVVYLQFKSNAAHSDPRGKVYAGSAACAKCHGGIYRSYLHTAHYMASDAATEKTVHGNFIKDANVFKINSSRKIVMEKRSDGMFQSYYVNNKVVESHRFDIVLGGIKGESYLYWKGNELYQLPVSYYSVKHQWATSPGYEISMANYNRAIGMRCFECHASFVNELALQAQQLTKQEQFDKRSLVYSIDCERCHGPGARHVEFHNNNPDVKTARFITKYSALTRGQKLDACAICHSGNASTMLRSTFEFRPGDTLANFKMADFHENIDSTHLDVHGNQLQLLQSSKCFINSKMDCSTCHDIHQNSHGDDLLYTQKCLNCHNTPNHSYCKMTNKISADMLKINCIKCHMPALSTKAISMQVSDKAPSVQIFVHTHRIAIYPQEVEKILAYINK